MKYLTTGQLARKAGVTRQWIHQLAANGRIPSDGTTEENGTVTYLFKEKTANRIAEQIKAQRSLPSRRRRKFE